MKPPTVTPTELDHAESWAEKLDPTACVFPAEIVRRLEEERDALRAEVRLLKRKSTGPTNMKQYYVYRPCSPGPTVKHTLESAKAEALRLAARHPGVRFEILLCVGEASTEVPEPKLTMYEPETPPESSLPRGVPPPPEGFEYWGIGPLCVRAYGASELDVAGYGADWATGGHGVGTGRHYALRKGTRIHEVNFAGRAEGGEA